MLSKRAKRNFVQTFAVTLARQGETFFASGDADQDYDLIRGTIDQQGYWSGVTYRLYFDKNYKLTHLTERSFG